VESGGEEFVEGRTTAVGLLVGSSSSTGGALRRDTCRRARDGADAKRLSRRGGGCGPTVRI
jgi:hypothetical protein